MKDELRQTIISFGAAGIMVLVASYFQGYISRAEYDQNRVEQTSQISVLQTKVDSIKDDVAFIRQEIVDHLKENHK